MLNEGQVLNERHTFREENITTNVCYIEIYFKSKENINEKKT